MQKILITIRDDDVEPYDVNELADLISESYIGGAKVTAEDVTLDANLHEAEWKLYVNPDDVNDINWCCTACKRIIDFQYAFCPFCGRRMKN